MQLTRRSALGGIAGSAALLATARPRPAAAAYNLATQSMWQANTVNQRALEEFAKRVQERSGGEITFDVMPVGAIVPYNEALDALRAGILQATNGGIGYYVGKDPAFALITDLNCGFETPEQFTGWFYDGGGNELTRELYANYGAYFVGPVLWGAESIPSRRPLRNIQDFQGLKMRAPEGLGAAIWAKLGVGVTTLPGTEVYSALERGRIEATDWGTLGMNDELGYGKIAEYAIYPGIHSMPASDIAIKLDIWEDMSAEQRQLVADGVVALNRDSIARNAELDHDFAAKRDPATLIAWGPDERRELREVAVTVWVAIGLRSA